MLTQLPFTGTLSVISFFKKKGKYEYCFDSIPMNYWLSTMVGFSTRLIILAMQVAYHLKKPLLKALQDTAAVTKNKRFQVFKNLFRKQRKPKIKGAHF